MTIQTLLRLCHMYNRESQFWKMPALDLLPLSISKWRQGFPGVLTACSEEKHQVLRPLPYLKENCGQS